MMRKTLWFPLFLTGLLSLTSCSNGLLDGTKAAGLTVRFGTPARTVAADWQTLVAKYEVTLTNTGGQGHTSIGPVIPSPANATSLVIPGVSSGQWTVVVNAFDASDALVASGSLPGVTLPVDTVQVPLNPAVGGGNGGFVYQVSYPEVFVDAQNQPITAVTASLFYSAVSGHANGDFHSNLTPTLSSSSGTTTARVEAPSLPSGTYLLKMAFLRADASVAKSFPVKINVWNNVVSDRWIDDQGVPQTVHTLSEADFNSSNAQLADLTATIDSVSLSLGTFVPGTNLYSATVSSATATQDLVLTATGSQPGQSLWLSTDNKATFTPLASGVPSSSVTLNQGLQTVWIRVQASGWFLANTLINDYQIDLTKVVPVTGVELALLNPASVATDVVGASWSASVVPSFADNPTVTWESLDTTLADIDPDTGVITPKLPGTVTLLATSADGGFTAEADLVLLPSSFPVLTRDAGLWTTEPQEAPEGTLAVAGSGSLLYALTDSQQVWWYDGAFWQSNPAMVPDAPAGTRWLAVLANGSLAAASDAQVFVCDLTGTWTPLTGDPGVPIAGLATTPGSLWVMTIDAGLWSWDGLWTPRGSVPAGTTVFGGSGTLWVQTPTNLLSYDGAFWNSEGPALAQASSITHAFNRPTILVVR